MMRYTLAYTRSWCMNHPNRRIQLEGEVEQAITEKQALEEVVKLLQARLKRAKSRPQHSDEERAMVLEIKSMTGWTNKKRAKYLHSLPIFHFLFCERQ
ncbi:hypothetical protein BVY04_02235 [bacterium M21]|nr:hypothetical protein BVY04_02235 [bacterium M21]